ncbi:MAG: hypothetical protein AABW80_01700 [Nanoarchaeota archaeon]
MGSRKIKKTTDRKNSKLDSIVDITQLSFGVIFAVYGLITNNTILMGIGGLLLMFCRREISIPFKKK